MRVKGVVYEHQAAAAVDTAKALWPRLGDAVEALEWALVRDPEMGVPLIPGRPMRMVVFEGARSIGMPTIEVIFEDATDCLTLHDLEFRK